MCHFLSLSITLILIFLQAPNSLQRFLGTKLTVKLLDSHSLKQSQGKGSEGTGNSASSQWRSLCAWNLSPPPTQESNGLPCDKYWASLRESLTPGVGGGEQPLSHHARNRAVKAVIRNQRGNCQAALGYKKVRLALECVTLMIV